MKRPPQNTATQELKRLQSLHHQLSIELNALRESASRYAKEIHLKETSLKEVDAKIRSLKGADGNIIVSEHAIVRYLERVYKLDIEKLKQEILPDKIVQQAKKIGNGRYGVIDHTLLIKDNVVVTVYSDGAA